jgi:hypothetical protein
MTTTETVNTAHFSFLLHVLASRMTVLGRLRRQSRPCDDWQTRLMNFGVYTKEQSNKITKKNTKSQGCAACCMRTMALLLFL